MSSYSHFLVAMKMPTEGSNSFFGLRGIPSRNVHLRASLVVLCIWPTILSSHTLEATTNSMVEVTLISSREYDSPQDVALDCLVTGPGGVRFNVAGFWDGDTTYRVRFALPAEGVWSYFVTCSDTTNQGLQGVHGAVQAVRYKGPNLFYRKGHLRVSTNNRYLSYGDGDPFFYLGDTAWEITWKSREPDMLAYLSDRVKKGFNALQIVVMSHEYFPPLGVTNRYGATVFLDSAHSRINPRYFDYLDRIVHAANDSGFAVVLAPLWAGMMEYYDLGPDWTTLTVDQSLRLARYVGARYAGSNVIWIVGGDNEYSTQQKRDFWALFARTLKSASGGSHLMTVHPGGWTASYDYFDASCTWIDFNMYQSSHVAGAKGWYAWSAALQGYAKTSKPLLDGESCYEDIYDTFWAPDDPTHPQKFRIPPLYVREASYEAVLSGALVGVTYGANGVWQWDTPEVPEPPGWPRVGAIEAEQFPGSSQMAIVKSVMQKLPWYNAAPAQNHIADFRSAGVFIPIAATNDRMIAYFPCSTAWVRLNSFLGADSARFWWINPTTGDSSSSWSLPKSLVFFPPDTSDWLLAIAPRSAQSDSGNPAVPVRFLLEQNFPNPFNPSTTIKYELSKASDVDLTVFDVLGRQVSILVNERRDAGVYEVSFDGSHLASGVYFYRLSAGGFVATHKALLVR